jgi:hypothetical protein
VSRLSRKCGSLGGSQPYGPPRPVTGIILTFTFYEIRKCEAASNGKIPVPSLMKIRPFFFRKVFSEVHVQELDKNDKYHG